MCAIYRPIERRNGRAPTVKDALREARVRDPEKPTFITFVRAGKPR